MPRLATVEQRVRQIRHHTHLFPGDPTLSATYAAAQLASALLQASRERDLHVKNFHPRLLPSAPFGPGGNSERSLDRGAQGGLDNGKRRPAEPQIDRRS